MSKNIKLRLQFLELYESGQRTRDIARELNKDPNYITNLKQQYLVLGQEEFLKDKNGRKVSGKLKQQIVSEYHEKAVSLNFLSLKYKVSVKAVQKWVIKAQKDGIETLYGRQKNMAKKQQLINEPEILKENKRLKEENECLKAENDYLKKLEPLVADKKELEKKLKEKELENLFLKKLRALVEEERANFIKNALGSSKN